MSRCARMLARDGRTRFPYKSTSPTQQQPRREARRGDGSASGTDEAVAIAVKRLKGLTDIALAEGGHAGFPPRRRPAKAPPPFAALFWVPAAKAPKPEGPLTHELKQASFVGQLVTQDHGMVPQLRVTEAMHGL